jgi:hypothetical protein
VRLVRLFECEGAEGGGGGETLTLLGGDNRLARSRVSKNEVNFPNQWSVTTTGSGQEVRRLTGAKSIKHSKIRCEVNVAKKYTVESFTILSRIVGITDGPESLFLRPAQTTITNARRSMSGCGFPSRERIVGQRDGRGRKEMGILPHGK